MSHTASLEYEKEDPLYDTRLEYMTNLYGVVVRGPLDLEDATKFCDDILDSKLGHAFRRTEKPIRVNEAFLVRGEVKTANGDEPSSAVSQWTQHDTIGHYFGTPRYFRLCGCR